MVRWTWCYAPRTCSSIPPRPGPTTAFRSPARFSRPCTRVRPRGYVVEISDGLRLMAEQQNTLGEPRHREGDRVEVYVDPAAVYAVPKG